MIRSDERYLTTPELAKRWRLRPHTLANWRALGKGPAFIRLGKTGAPVLYPYDAVLAFEKLAPDWLNYQKTKP